MLELMSVYTSYGKIKMLENIDLVVNQGEVVCLLGSNGAGKSTTIKTIVGLLTPNSGQIHFEGQSLNSLKTFDIVRRGISIAPEGRRLFPRMTVEQNLLIGLDEEKSNCDQLKCWIFELFPALKNRLNQAAGTLSGGEQAMVSISRALMQEPKLLILDEPSFGLAPILVEAFYQTITEINRHGTTILLSEQNAGKALEVSCRGYVLQKGTIHASGSKEELLDNDLVRACYLG
ncbi:MAG: ABC transporter ATP-binding protein [Proteobacteria bacterium]|nr:ABC transporter ATP-binding protein [Pseudomonadota bacterium]MBU1057506.1 ABC transporter ATP-binding protein [Pseudomonadota bacterium]